MDTKIQRLQNKLKVFENILNQITHLSVASTKRVGCMALRKDFSKIASFGYNGSFSGAEINPSTGTEEDSLVPGESGFIHAEVNMIAKFKENDRETEHFKIFDQCKITYGTLDSLLDDYPLIKE